VQLWATLVEFLYQFGDVGSDGAWVDVVIVSEVLNRQLGKEISKAAQFVDVKWNRYDGVITYLWKAVANVTIIDAESELVAAAALEPKNVTKIGTAILIFELFLEPGKTLENARHFQVGCLLAPVAALVGQGEIRRVIFAAYLERDDMVNI